MGSKTSMSSKKKGTHTFFGPNIVPKKVWVPKKRNSYFFRAQHSAKKSMGSKKSMSSKKKGTHTIFGPNIVPKKSMGSKKKYEFQKKRNSYFCRYFFNRVQTKKKYRQKSTQKYEFLFFWNSYFFWNTYFFWHYVGPGKSMSSFFSGTHTFFGTCTFFGTMCGSKKV